jgi:hypothetical protein
MLQTRVKSKKVRGQVPDHAGQWAVVEGEAPDAMAADAAAFQLFRASTGIDLGDPEVTAKYGLEAPRIEKLKDANYTPFTVFYLEAGRAGLEALAGDIEGNINTPANLVDGIYAEADALRLSQALARIGPIPPPQDGWAKFIQQTYYAGAGIGALDRTFPALVSQIAQRSRMSGELYAIALAKLPGGAPVPPPPQPRRLRLEIENAEPVPGTESTYVADYAPGSRVTIRALVEPRDPGATITWQGGDPDPAAGNDRRILPRDRVTALGHPVTVTASLGEVRQSMSLIVRPLLGTPEVVNAERVPELEPIVGGRRCEWIAEYGEHEAPVEFRMPTVPDTAEAHTHLLWTGGEPDLLGRKNCRIVPRNRITGPDDPVKVRVAVNPWWDFILYILPRLGAINVIGPNIYNPAAGLFQVDYQAPPAFCQVRVTTFPDIALAHQCVDWSTGAAGVNQIAVPRDAINAVGVPTAYTARIQRRGQVLRSVTVNVLVQPTLNLLAFRGPAIDLGAGNWYSYDVAGQFGLPGGFATLLMARTLPDNVQAWHHIQWQNTDGPGPTLAQREINLNAVRNVVVGARIGLAPAQQLNLDIRARQAWPIGAPHLSIQQILFGGVGGRPVAHDDVGAQFGILFNQTWVAGTAHANQSPLTYTRNSTATANPTIAIAPGLAAAVNVNIRATAFVPRHNNPTHPVVHAWNGVIIVPPPPLNVALGAQAGHAALPNEVVYADPLVMFWEMQINGMGAWTLFDVTTHMLYATLGDPVAYSLGPVPPPPPPAAAPLYFTLLATSCRAAQGQNTADDVVEHMFNAFHAIDPVTGANLEFRRKLVPLNPPLTYWLPQPNAANSLLGMLTNVPAPNSGTCNAWAEMFIAMGAMHGINNGLNRVEVRANLAVSPEADGFLVRNWTFHAPPAPQALAYTHDFGPAVPGNATWGPGLVGQNNPAPPDAFENHFIVRYVPLAQLYDPSYGSGPHGTKLSWVDGAIDGLLGMVPPPLPLLPPPLVARAGFSRIAGAPVTRVEVRDRVTLAVL